MRKTEVRGFYFIEEESLRVKIPASCSFGVLCWPGLGFIVFLPEFLPVGLLNPPTQNIYKN